MAWIKADQSLLTHPKTARLARLLSIKPVEVVGMMLALWWWAVDYAEDGVLLPKYDAYDIADAMRWEGDAPELLDALVSAKFLDSDGDTVKIHDFEDYSGEYVDKREKWAEKKKRQRDKQRNLSKTAECPPNVPQMSPKCPIFVSDDSQKCPPQDIEIDKEIDKETDKESCLSIPPSSCDTLSACAREESEPVEKPVENASVEKVVENFSEILPDLADTVKYDTEDVTAATVAISEHPNLEYFRELFRMVGRSDFLLGRASNSTFRAAFAWILQNRNEIMSGKYSTYRTRGAGEILDELKNKYGVGG